MNQATNESLSGRASACAAEAIHAAEAGPSAATLEDPRLIEALETYRAELDAGRRPDQSAFLARYPDVADVLGGCLAALEFVHVVAPDLSDPGREEGNRSGSPSVIRPEAPLGDFRIMREVGRGGMGVVYEAMQLSLGRRVALKILPFAAALDPRHLQRFKNEAQAAANLHHTNIVPVFGVGCERGVHYYAMQFIDGQSLSEVVRELRGVESRGLGVERQKDGAERVIGDQVIGDRSVGTSPAGTISTEASNNRPEFYRTVVSLGVQAAEALEYAHSMGIVHRDIKPANLLVDARRNLWITDFGLAQIQTDAGLTLTGDLVGTLRYMSPEQTLAHRMVVDHRTDIYSLGVSLYELLTLEPAFPSDDRHELLRQIASEEPRRLRQLDGEIPRELDTIVLKAIAKDRAARYATAQELADDLRRFLEDKPIRAKPPTLRQRMAKWSRRHRAVVVTATVAAAVLLVVSVIGLAVSNALIARERTKALQDRDKATVQGKRAGENYSRARRAVDAMLDRVHLAGLEQVPQMKQLRRDLAQEALAIYEGFLEESRGDENSADLNVHSEIASIYTQVGAIYSAYLERHVDAEKAYRRARELWEQLMADDPSVSSSRSGLAGVLVLLADMLQKSPGRQHEVEEHYRQAIALWDELARDFPAEPYYRFSLAYADHRLGYFLAMSGRPQEAEPFYRQAIAVLEKLAAEFPANSKYKDELADSCISLGLLLSANRRPQEAERALRQALSVLEALSAEPNAPDTRWGQARSLFHLAGVLRQLGRVEEAEAAARQCLTLRESVAADHPLSSEVLAELAATYRSFGEVAEAQRRTDEAEQYYRKALAIREKVLAEFPEVPDCRGQLANTLYRLANLVAATDRNQEAVQFYARLIELDPDSPNAYNNLAWYLATCREPQFRDPARAVELARRAVEMQLQNAFFLNTLGVAHYRAGNWQEAVDACAKSVQIFAGRMESFNTFFIAMAHWQLGNQAEARKWYDQAVEWMEQKAPQNEELLRFRAESAALLGISSQPTQ